MMLSLWALPLLLVSSTVSQHTTYGFTNGPSADAPSAFIPTAATAAGGESVVDCSSSGPEVSGKFCA